MEGIVGEACRHPADVTLRFFDLNGREVGVMEMGHRNAGTHRFSVDAKRLRLSPASHVYQLEASNANGYSGNAN